MGKSHVLWPHVLGREVDLFLLVACHCQLFCSLANKLRSFVRSLYAVMKSFLRLFTPRKGTLTAEFEKQLADNLDKNYQSRKQLTHVLRHWREDEEFARQVSTPMISRVRSTHS